MACEKVDNSTYTLEFDSVNKIDAIGIYDLIATECGYHFPERFSDSQFDILPDINVTIITSYASPMDLIYQDDSGKIVEKIRWTPPSYTKNEGIKLKTFRPYNTVMFSRKMQVYGLRIDLIGY